MNFYFTSLQARATFSFSWDLSCQPWLSSQRLITLDLQKESWHPVIIVENHMWDPLIFERPRIKPAFLFSNGTIYWPIHEILSVRCDMDLRDYPYDCQSCEIEIRSYTPIPEVSFNINQIGLSPEFVDPNEVWCVPSQCPGEFIRNTMIDLNFTKVKYTKTRGFDTSYDGIVVTINLCRIYTYYYWGIMTPYTIVSLFIPMVFAVPPNKEEHEEETKDKDGNKSVTVGIRVRMSFSYSDRLTYAITLFLTFIFFHSTVLSGLPEVSGSIWIIRAVAIRMVMLASSILVIVVISMVRKMFPELTFAIISDKWKKRKNFCSSKQVSPNSSPTLKTSRTARQNATSIVIPRGHENTAMSSSIPTGGHSNPGTHSIESDENGKQNKCTYFVLNLSLYLLLDIIFVFTLSVWLFLLFSNDYYMEAKPVLDGVNMPEKDMLLVSASF